MLARGDRLQLCTIIKVMKIMFSRHSYAEFQEISKFSFLAYIVIFEVKLQQIYTYGEFPGFND